MYVPQTKKYITTLFMRIKSARSLGTGGESVPEPLHFKLQRERDVHAYKGDGNPQSFLGLA